MFFANELLKYSHLLVLVQPTSSEHLSEETLTDGGREGTC